MPKRYSKRYSLNNKRRYSKRKYSKRKYKQRLKTKKRKNNSLKMKGGSGNFSKKKQRRLEKEMESLKMSEGMIIDKDTYFQVEYKGNTFHISLPEKWPHAAPKVNGLTLLVWSPTTLISQCLDKLINPELKNTLVYCHHNPDFHFLTPNWEKIFGSDFTQSNKVYFDSNRPAFSHPELFLGDGFGDEVLNYNNGLWDFIMVPDCGGLLLELTLNSKDPEKDTTEALQLLQRMLLNLKTRGQLWLTKTINDDLIGLLDQLDDNYTIDYIGIPKQADSLLHEKIHTPDGNLYSDIGVIITRSQ